MRHERLGDPDFTGEYRGSTTGQSGFSMYVLESRLSTSKVTPPDIRPNEIQGVIFDNIGLSTFSGVKTPDAITFTKSYLAWGRRNGGFDQIVYSGEFNKDTQNYQGEYTVSGTKLRGEFTLRPTNKLQQP